MSDERPSLVMLADLYKEHPWLEQTVQNLIDDTKFIYGRIAKEQVQAERERCIAIMVKAFGIPKEIIAEHLATKSHLYE